MALDPTTYGQQAEQALEQQIASGGALAPEDMSAEFAGIYYDYSVEGEADGVDVAAGGTQSILDPAFISDNTSATVTQIADAICDYWESVDTPGEATVLDVVISVTVDASAQRAPMEQAIIDYTESGPARNGWAGFYDATEEVVNQIPFEVTEQDTSTGSTTTYTAFVS